MVSGPEASQPLQDNSLKQESQPQMTGSNLPTESAAPALTTIPSSRVIFTPSNTSGPATLTVEIQLPNSFDQQTIDQTVKAAMVAGGYLELFARKQHAYGVGNIDGFGEFGVLVRTNDKLERLKRLIDPRVLRESDLEAVEDTWLDVTGYGLIGYMVHKNLWRAAVEYGLTGVAFLK